MRCTAPLSIGLFVLMTLSGCNSSSIQLNREWDDPADEEAAFESQSPEAFVERFGEPDTWANEGEENDLEMTAVWNCVDGKTHEVKWRQQDSSKGLRHWVVVSDITREGCTE